MYQLYCRAYQNVMKTAAYVLPWRKPELLQGKGALLQLPKLINNNNLQRVLIVTDAGIKQVGLLDSLLEELNKENIQYFIYDKTVPNPTIDNIEEAYELYQTNNCKAIIGFGGGSSIDCAKVVGARVACPDKSVEQMKGLLKVRKQLPPLFAVPTTAGTGSEVTVAAVVSNSKTKEKYAINDMALTPQYAILAPQLTIGLPPHLTATTGMDALTHAVEAYIGNSNTKETKDCAREAVQLIFENLYETYQNGENVDARGKMLKASYLAGIAFTRAYVGYVHAIAHTLGGFYQIPHGLANAVIMPYVLDSYGVNAHEKLAELADLVGIGNREDSDAIKATKFIQAIRQLNKQMNIPIQLEGIKEEDIPLMVERALAEANPLYPVPRIFNKKDVETIYHLIKK